MRYSILFKLSFLSNAIISLWVIFSWLRFYLPCWRLEFSWGCLNKPWYRYPRRLTLLSSIYSAPAWTPACLGCWAQKAFSSSSICSSPRGKCQLSILSIIPLCDLRASAAVATTLVGIVITTYPKWCGRFSQLSASPVTFMFTPPFCVAASAACFISWSSSLSS